MMLMMMMMMMMMMMIIGINEYYVMGNAELSHGSICRLILKSFYICWHSYVGLENETLLFLSNQSKKQYPKNCAFSETGNIFFFDFLPTFPIDVDTRFQLDLIRGEITRKPDTRKYIPVYMSFNSTKKDIPDFLSSRVSHSLPQEIDRVVFHLLNIERIQPRRRRMIAVIGGNNHPYDEAKKRFEEAVNTAARYHWKMQYSYIDGKELSTVTWKQ